MVEIVKLIFPLNRISYSNLLIVNHSRLSEFYILIGPNKGLSGFLGVQGMHNGKGSNRERTKRERKISPEMLERIKREETLQLLDVL